MPGGSYLALELGGGFGGGIVECATRRPCGSRTSRSTGRRGHRGPPARRLGAARATRGPGGMAQRRHHARGRGDRVLAGEGMTERAARRCRRAQVEPVTAPSSTRTATACSARRTTPRTRCRRRCSAPGAASPRFEGRSSLRSWLYTIATNACLKAIERRPQARAPGRLRPGGRPARRPGRAAGRVGVGRALSGRAARPRRRRRRPGGPLRAARERRARVRRRAPAPAGAPARRAHPARGARLLGRRGRRRARDDAGLGLQRTAARPQDRRRAAARRRASRPTLRALGDERLRAIVDRLRRRVGATATSTRVVAMLAEDATLAMPPMPTWYAGRDAVAGFLERMPLAGEHALARYSPHRASGQLGLGHYLYSEDERQLPPARRQRARAARRTRSPRSIAFLTPETFGRFGLPRLRAVSKVSG